MSKEMNTIQCEEWTIERDVENDYCSFCQHTDKPTLFIRFQGFLQDAGVWVCQPCVTGLFFKEKKTV